MISLTRALRKRAAGARALSSSEKQWKVYLSGAYQGSQKVHKFLMSTECTSMREIHSDWRDIIANGVKNDNLPVILTSPNTSHEDSDDCGAIILGMEEERRNWDRLGAKMNQIRTTTLIRDADVVVVRFGDKFRQWNAAFDTGYAAALGKPIITLHLPELGHMLKEVDAAANVVCQDPHQVVETLAYVIKSGLPEPRDKDKWMPIADRLGKGNPNP